MRHVPLPLSAAPSGDVRGRRVAVRPPAVAGTLGLATMANASGPLSPVCEVLRLLQHLSPAL